MNSEIDGRIRDAVAAGETGKAAALWETYVAQVADEIRCGSCSDARLAEMRELIEWTRGVVTCARAHAQLGMNIRRTVLHAAAVYAQMPR
jgi:hypothetical protein